MVLAVFCDRLRRGGGLPCPAGGGAGRGQGAELLVDALGEALEFDDAAGGVGNGRGAGLAAVEIVGEGAGVLVGSFYLMAERGRCFELYSYFSATLMVGQPARSIGLSGERRESGDDRAE